MDYSAILEKMMEIARGAGEIQLKHFRSGHLDPHSKLNNFDVVTIADRESEDYILSSIRNLYPGHSIVSEESGSDGGLDDEWCWVVDPLDGTTNYNQGLPIFSVSIALRHHGEVVAGVVFAPQLGEMFTAARGNGAWLNGSPIHCSRKTDLSTMVVATGMPYDRDRNPDNNLDNISRVVCRVRGTRRMGSAAIDLAYTAAGFIDAYWELNLNPWDVDAGSLIVTEAGGQIKSIRTDRNCSILAASPETMEVFGPLIK